MNRQSMLHQRMEAVTDLATLSSLSDDVIVACLRERFMADTIYTSIGTSGLVAVNPHKYVSTNADSVMHKNASEYRDTKEDKETLPPHIFQLANNAYYHMRRTTQDQSIIFSGETTSGKSENRRLAIKTLLKLSVSNPGKKGSKLATQVPASDFVLDNTRTLFNPNASRFGKYTELQFSGRGSQPRLSKRWGSHSSFKSNGALDRSGFPAFTILHFNGPVTYSPEGFLACNLDALNPDFGLFSGRVIATTAHPRNEDTIVAAQQPVKPMRAPSTRRKGTVRCAAPMSPITADATIEEEDRAGGAGGGGGGGGGADEAGAGAGCVAGEFRSALDTLFATLDKTQAWHIFCVNPNDSQLPNQLEGRSVKGQVRSAGLAQVARRNACVFEVGMTCAEFCERYREGLEAGGMTEGTENERVEQARMAFGLGERDVVVGVNKVYLSQAVFHRFEDHIRARNVEEQKRSRMRDTEIESGLDPRGMSADPYAPYPTTGFHRPGQDGNAWSAAYSDPFHNGTFTAALQLVANASPFQRAGMYERDADYDEHKSLRSGAASEYDAHSRFTPTRTRGDNKRGGPALDKDALVGEIQEGETAEVLKESSARRRWVLLCWILTWWVPTAFLTHCGRMKRIDVRQAWREKLALNLMIWFTCAAMGFVIVALRRLICPTEHVSSTSELAGHGFSFNPNNVYTAVRGEVFDLNTITALHSHVVGVVPAKLILRTYGGTFADDVFPVQISTLCNGIDGGVSPYLTFSTANNTDKYAQVPRFPLLHQRLAAGLMRWTVRVGFVGYTPKEIRSMANNGSSVGVYNGLVYDLTDYTQGQRGLVPPAGQSAPDDSKEFIHSKVIDISRREAGGDVTKAINNLDLDAATLTRQKVCLRNLFTIGKLDTRKPAKCIFSTYLLLILSIIMVSTISFKFLASISLAGMRAPEDHDKFVICQVPCYTEGDTSLRRTIDSLAQLKYDNKRKLLIVGSGNDRPMPRIVLDILGADPNLDPEPLSFLKARSSITWARSTRACRQADGALAPGQSRQVRLVDLLMHFLNKVHFNSPMNPLELEMCCQIKNVIGLNPTFYEYIFMVDADTTLDEFSVNRPISSMIHDKKLLGVCGETELANAKQSIITMIDTSLRILHLAQHAKVFESLFGSVTCLPGCFTLYRLRTPDTHKPLLISNQLIADYSENRVDTLHMKNLLHLGEDRYLTTLLLKHFPLHILLSQRCRWINSTVHNLGELVFLEQLCGFCCSSLRFIVVIDLVSTLTQPVSVLYIGYLIYLVAAKLKGEQIQTVSLIMIFAIYAIQALLRRKWDMIGWMVLHPRHLGLLGDAPLLFILADGRLLLGSDACCAWRPGKNMIVHDKGKFDPRSIPLKSWNDDESNHSIGSWVPPPKLRGDGYIESRTASLYGRETTYEPRRYSPTPSQAGGYVSVQHHPPPGYQSGRNTPQSMRHDPGMMMPQPHMASRPVTNYLDIPIGGSPDELDLPPGTPTKAELDRAVQEELRSADLKVDYEAGDSAEAGGALGDGRDGRRSTRCVSVANKFWTKVDIDCCVKFEVLMAVAKQYCQMTTPKRSWTVLVTEEGLVYTLHNDSELPHGIPSFTTNYGQTTHPSNFLRAGWASNELPHLSYCPSHPQFVEPIFGRLGYTMETLPIESITVAGVPRFKLDSGLANTWMSTFHLQYKHIYPSAYGYLRAHSNERLARKRAMISRDGFVTLIAMCSHAISLYNPTIYQDEGYPRWAKLLVEKHHIHPQWIQDLLQTQVADFTPSTTKRVGVFVDPSTCNFLEMIPTMIDVGIPVRIYWGPVEGPSHGSHTLKSQLLAYKPSRTDITNGTNYPETLFSDIWAVVATGSDVEDSETMSQFFARRDRDRPTSIGTAFRLPHAPTLSKDDRVFMWTRAGSVWKREEIRSPHAIYFWDGMSSFQRRYDSSRHEWDLCEEWKEEANELELWLSETPAIENMSPDFGTDVVERHPTRTPNQRARPLTFEEMLHLLYGYTAEPNLPRTITNGAELKVDTVQFILGSYFEAEDRTLPKLTEFISHMLTPNPLIPGELWDLSKSSLCQLKMVPDMITQTIFKGVTRYTLNNSSDSYPWTLTVQHASLALQYVRMMAKNPKFSIEKAVRHMLRSGSPFNTFQIRQNNSTETILRLQPSTISSWRQRDYKPDTADYHGYMQACERLLQQDSVLRAALLKGGIIWRLALDSLPKSKSEDEVVTIIMAGPTSTAFFFGLKVDQSVDDDLTEAMEDLICGVYKIDTSCDPHPNQTSTSSWWPTNSIWYKSGLNYGYWTDKCESWFVKRRENILAGKESVKKATEWNKSIKFSPKTRKFRQANDAAAAKFIGGGTFP
ncbi:chitin synthase-domain-containing protein [Mycena rebaudengoi]|nr:chitin synthase-domain-containing protein [Mycena rebaudengoi]